MKKNLLELYEKLLIVEHEKYKITLDLEEKNKTFEEMAKNCDSSQHTKYLKALKEEIMQLQREEQKKNRKIANIKANFFTILKSKMEKAYNQVGIDEDISIEQATIVANTKNFLALEYQNKEGK